MKVVCHYRLRLPHSGAKGDLRSTGLDAVDVCSLLALLRVCGKEPQSLTNCNILATLCMPDNGANSDRRSFMPIIKIQEALQKVRHDENQNEKGFEHPTRGKNS